MTLFATLCIAVCLAVFLLTAASAVLLANLASCLLRYWNLRESLIRFPTLLFCLRVFPFALAVITALGFTLPAFLLLEPRRTTERPEAPLLIAAGLALAVLIVLTVRCARILQTTRRLVQNWQGSGKLLHISGVSLPVYAIENPGWLLSVTGFINPKVFIGGEVLSCLSPEELRAAVQHEASHVRSFDNLKQLVLRITELPSWFSQLAWLDTAWSLAAEFAADEDALREGTSMLDLGSALVKVGRLSHSTLGPSSLAVCHLIPPNCSSALELRVRHLQNLIDETGYSPKHAAGTRVSASLFAIGLAAYAAVLPSSLSFVHRAIELLVQ